MHVIVGLETGGAEAMLVRLVQALPDHTQIIVSLTGIGPLGRELQARGFAVHALGMRLPSGARALVRLWRLIRQHRPDVLQTWMYHADLLGGIVGRLAGVRRIVWNVRNTEIPQRRLSATGAVIRLCAALSRWVPHHIVCCALAARDKHLALGYRRDRLLVIPNGFDVRAWQPPAQSREDLRAEYGLPVDAFVVGTVGRFDPLKGYDVLAAAAAAMAERVAEGAPLELVFVLVGRGVDAGNAALCSLIERTGGRARFKLMGERRDVARIMATLDVYCLSSRAEGFPNVLAEAMLMCTPCVATDVGDARLIVGATGLVVPADDPAALAEGLLAFARMPETERRLRGQAARQRIEDEFGIEVIAQRYADLYEHGRVR